MEAKPFESLNEARRVASKEGFTSELRQIHCLLGQCTGISKFTQFCKSMIQESSEYHED